VAPSISIFVRHSQDCKYGDDETWRRCNCRKHLRWSQDGKQYRRSAGTRSWEQAETERRKLEEQFAAGAKPTAVTADDHKTIARAVELFLSEKRTEGVAGGVLKKYERELERLKDFLHNRSVYFPSDIGKEVLTEYRSTWGTLYPSSATRQQVQSRVRRFLRFCHDAGWIERLPKLSPIKVDEPPTMPLSPEQYTTLLTAVPTIFPGVKAGCVRALIQLMRHSGLAIRDAVTLERGELVKDTKKKIYRVATSRQKTGTHVSVPIPDIVAKEILTVLNGNPRYVFWNGNGLEQSAVTNWQHDLRTVFRATFGRDTHFTPHCLRDTAAVEWLSAGIPLEEVSKLLGHTSVRTTEKHYAPWVTARQDRLDTLVVGTWASAKPGKDGADV
jgi:integrase/recombinase XerD